MGVSSQALKRSIYHLLLIYLTTVILIAFLNRLSIKKFLDFFEYE